MKKIIRIVVLGVVSIFTQVSFAANPFQVFKQDRFDVEIKTQFFKSESNFDSGGSKKDLVSGNYYQNLEVTPRVRWGLMSDVGLYGGLNIGSAESSDPLTTRKNSTLNRIDLGVDYLFYRGDGFELIGDFGYSQATETVATNTDLVLNSSGASEIQPQIIARFDFDGIYPFAQGGLNYRTSGFSTLLTYRAGSEFRFTNVALGGALQGFVSVLDDENVSQAALRDNVTGRVSGGSKRYYSINPSLHEIEGYLNYSLSSNFLVKFFGSYALAGANTAMGYAVGATINWTFGDFLFQERSHQRNDRSNEHAVPNKKNPTPSISRDPNPTDFKEDINDGVNQDYFKIVPTTKDNYFQKVEEQPVKQQPSPHEGDYQIQIKKTKKKKTKK